MGSLWARKPRRLATKSGCSLANPYVHFKNQSEILQALISQGEADLTRRLREAEAKHTDLHQKLSEIAHAYWAFGTHHRELHRLMFSNGERRLYVKKIRYVQPSFRVFLHAIRKGTKEGEFLNQSVNSLEIARAVVFQEPVSRPSSRLTARFSGSKACAFLNSNAALSFFSRRR